MGNNCGCNEEAVLSNMEHPAKVNSENIDNEVRLGWKHAAANTDLKFN